MTCNYPELAIASDWSYREGNQLRPIRNTTQIWVETRHQYVSFSIVRQTSFPGETSDDAVRCQLFSQIKGLLKSDIFTIVSNDLKNNLAVN